MAKSILIVEDNEDLRHIVASVLRAYGYEIVEAASGAEAMERAASAQPHLILLDLNLPDCPGIHVARSIKKNLRSAHIPIIACALLVRAKREKNHLLQEWSITCKNRFRPSYSKRV